MENVSVDGQVVVGPASNHLRGSGPSARINGLAAVLLLVCSSGGWLLANFPREGVRNSRKGCTMALPALKAELGKAVDHTRACGRHDTISFMLIGHMASTPWCDGDQPPPSASPDGRFFIFVKTTWGLRSAAYRTANGHVRVRTRH